MRASLLAALASLTFAGCTLSTGGYYIPTGPHPHVSFAVRAEAGPFEVLHAATSNLRPSIDLTRFSVNVGPRLGPLRPTAGVGLALFRDWGPCDSAGYNCTHDWDGSLTLGAGLALQLDRAQLSVAVHCYDGDSPLSCATAFMVGAKLF